MAKGGLARERFEAKKQRNRIISQLNQLRGMGYSTEDIRAAGPNAWQTLAGGGTRVVTDTDTVESIATANGVNPVDVLSANPDVKKLQTGQVINVPRPGSEAWRVQNAYGGGLPSNSPLGGTTNNPQGLNAYQQSERTILPPADAMKAQYNRATPPGAPNPSFFQSPQSSNWFQAAGDWLRGLGQNVPITGTPSPYQPYRPPSNLTWSQNLSQPTATPAQPIQPPRPTVARAPTSLPPTYPGGFRRWVGEEMAQINTPGYTPNNVTLKYLEQLGLIKKSTPSPTYGGGGGYRRGKRRGGGGGGGGGAPRPGTIPQPREERLPAFSSGAGFGGLVNWRL